MADTQLATELLGMAITSIDSLAEQLRHLSAKLSNPSSIFMLQSAIADLECVSNDLDVLTEGA